MLTCSSPGLFAAYRVLLRQSVPWHPPCALIRLILPAAAPFLRLSRRNNSLICVFRLPCAVFKVRPGLRRPRPLPRFLPRRIRHTTASRRRLRVNVGVFEAPLCANPQNDTELSSNFSVRFISIGLTGSRPAVLRVTASPAVPRSTWNSVPHSRLVPLSLERR